MFEIEGTKKKSYKRPIKWALLLVYFAVLYLILPVSLAVFIAYLAYPLMQIFHNLFKMPFWLAAILTEIILLLSICIIVLITFQSILSVLPALKENLANISFLENYDSLLFTFIQEKSMALFELLLSTITQIIQNILQYIVEGFVFVVALFFALFESRKSRNWFFIYAPPSYRKEWKNYFSKGMQLFSYFLYVEFQLIVLTFLLLCGGLAILGFENSISKAFIIALSDSLPFFGIGLFLVPMSIYYLIIGETYFSVIIIFLYIFIQFTRQLTESMLWASTLHLRTVHTFFISAASILLFGFYGILLSPLLLFLAVRFKERNNVYH